MLLLILLLLRNIRLHFLKLSREVRLGLKRANFLGEPLPLTPTQRLFNLLLNLFCVPVNDIFWICIALCQLILLLQVLPKIFLVQTKLLSLLDFLVVSFKTQHLVKATEVKLRGLEMKQLLELTQILEPLLL